MRCKLLIALGIAMTTGYYFSEDESPERFFALLLSIPLAFFAVHLFAHLLARFLRRLDSDTLLYYETNPEDFDERGDFADLRKRKEPIP
jgi:hypothetical protein